MCEQFIARSRSGTSFRLDALWDVTERLERYGMAQFGWGAAWITGDGGIGSHRDPRAFRDDPARERVGANETTSLIVHLRRPSKLSTIGLPDTQPFVDPATRFAFVHNGDLGTWRPWRDRFQAQGRIAGRADSEVGARWLEDEWRPGEPVAHLLGALHDEFGGNANLGLLEPSGAAHLYSGNRDNPVFALRLGDLDLACTGIHSHDRSLFRYVCPGATERRLVPFHRTVSLG